MVITTSQAPKLRPIAVSVQDYGGSAIPSAHVRATYSYSGLSCEATTADDGVAGVPLLYCDKEPMRIEAVAPGYHAGTVNEYRPDLEDHKLLVTLEQMKSDWEQVIIPLDATRQNGSVQHPVLGRVDIAGNSFRITNVGEVSVNGNTSQRHGIGVGTDYHVLTRDGTEFTLRFLEFNPKFSATVEFSPPQQHNCAP